MTNKEDIPVSLSQPAVVSLNKKIYVYDPLLNKWSTAANMPTSKVNFDAEVINGKIYTFGGFFWGESYNKYIEEYTPLGDHFIILVLQNW